MSEPSGHICGKEDFYPDGVCAACELGLADDWDDDDEWDCTSDSAEDEGYEW